jgi:AAA+ ATPase superfamily predicted ATPase
LELTNAVFNSRVQPVFDSYVGYALEEAAQAFIARLARQGNLPFLPERIGRWWTNHEEMDLVATSDVDKTALVGECKWSTKPVGINILEDLQRKTHLLRLEGDWQQVHYALFSKSGFTPELQTKAQSENILLVEPLDLVAETPLSRF